MQRCFRPPRLASRAAQTWAFVLACLAAPLAAGEACAAAGASTIAVPRVAMAPPLDPRAAAAWSGAASVRLERDVVHARAATETTTATIETDGRFLYARFTALQREGVVATQRSNNVGNGTDDEVWVDLWPSGTSGYEYQFIATPLGTQYQTSSENTTYQPTWSSAGAPDDGGYVVVMRIPLAALRGAHSGAWRVQFVRLIHATGEEQVWSYGSAQTNPDDLAYAGTAKMPSLVAARPQPRVAVYALGAVASKTAGGSTSRSGADLSLPLTPTASFFATLHPDFSNVELDQQTISPTPFVRQYQEVRPFFTQGASFFNQTTCYFCPGIQALYTPAIPTPREGYAVEGQQGHLGFATYDADGAARNDLASVFDYTTPDLNWSATLQRVAVTTPTFIDDVTTSGLLYSDRKHASAYLDYGDDSGTNVKDGSDAQWYDGGGGWTNPTFAAFASLRKVGDYFNPVDGIVQHPGVAGFAAYSNKIWLFGGDDKLTSIALGGAVDSYHGNTGAMNQYDDEVLLDILTKNAIDLQVSTGSDYLRSGKGGFAPVSQNGVVLTYHSGTQQEPGSYGQHGTSATPTSITYFSGRYGLGRLDTWLRSSTVRAGVRATVTFELDDTAQWFSRGVDNVQWFERASYAYQFGPDSSLAIGVRRVVGMPPSPNGGGDCTSVCSNISLAYHLRQRRSELYIGYGDPDALFTTPEALVKFIYYFGAEKGT